jgi:hypothetical protein
MDRKRTVRVLNKAMLEKPRWTEAVLPAYVGKECRRIELLRACANGDIYYYGNLIGNDDEVAGALIDIVNSHEKTLGGPSEQAMCWAVTELIRRKNTHELPESASPSHRMRTDYWADAVLPVYVGKQRIELLRVCSNGDIYYYGKLIGSDGEIAAALVDIVNSHEKTVGGPSNQGMCWAVTELIRRSHRSPRGSVV